jgi:AmmeMemoRadiSam system protein B
LCQEVDSLLGEAAAASGRKAHRALIVPHAGYIYSGRVAASAFRCIIGAGGKLTRVVVIGPSHHVSFRGIAAPRGADAFRTPLGEVPLDRRVLAELPAVILADEPHRREHAIEVELPFLQRALGDGFSLVPLVVGDATDEEVTATLEPFAADPATLVVVSSDLSHFLTYEAAGQRDRATAEAIERLHGAPIGPYDACGRLEEQRRHGRRPAERRRLRCLGVRRPVMFADGIRLQSFPF